MYVAQLKGAACGVGVARRNVTCAAVGNDYAENQRTLTNVSPSSLNYNMVQTLSNFGYEPAEKCYNKSPVTFPPDEKKKYILDLHDEDTCLKSCSTDCIVSEWGEWTSCRGKCVGVQTGKIR